MRQAVSSMALPSEGARVWHSGMHRDRAYGTPMRVGNFKPFVWVGGARRGLAFMADNDQGWVPDETLRVPAIEVQRTVQGVELVLNLVARPVLFSRPREFAFSLQATPVRPMPADFRRRITQTNNTLAFPGIDDDSLAWDGTFWRGHAHGGPAFPLDWTKNRRFREDKTREGWIYTPYQAANAWLNVVEAEDPRAPGLQGASLYAYIANEITASLSWGDAVMTRTDADYRLWRYARWIAESGLSGFYFDNAYPSAGTNVTAGQGYILDLPDRPSLDGRVQPGYALTGFRDFLKRLRTVLVDAGQDSFIMLHATDTYLASAYAFADYMIDGENAWMRPDTVFADVWTEEHLQTLGPSAKWGLGTFFLEAATKPGRFAGAQHKSHMLAYLMLHDLDVWEAHEFWGALTKGGLDLSRSAEFLVYWDPTTAATVRARAPELRVSAWRQDRALFLLAFNHSWTPLTDATMDVDLSALRPGGSRGAARVRDIMSDVARSGRERPPRVAVTGDRMSIGVDVEAQMWRALRVDIP